MPAQVADIRLSLRGGLRVGRGSAGEAGLEGTGCRRDAGTGTTHARDARGWAEISELVNVAGPL